ncbi:3'-5' exonuclease [Amphritea sp. HPY]|uniref:3'-5' exonuclease n=1 Tax=Amphritea sp. HPY TaxID=3421652 RepID=UPI003D7CE221
MSSVMNDSDIYKGLLKFIITDDKIRYITELMVAIDIENGKIWPSSRQHMLEILRDTIFENMAYSDSDLYDIIMEKVKGTPSEKLDKLLRFDDLDLLLKKFDHQDSLFPKKEKEPTPDRRSFRTESDISKLLSLATDEQIDIINRVNSDNRSITLQGYAGCGKTTAIEQIFYSNPSRQNDTLFTAFNRSIVRSVTYRNEHLEAKTFDSLGCKFGLKRSPWIGEDLTVEHIDYTKLSEILGIKGSTEITGHPSIKGNKISRLCYSIVESYCNSSLNSLDISLVPKEITGIDARLEILHLSNNLWSIMIATPDLFGVPVIRPSFVTKHWSLMGGRLPRKYSRVFLDEAQDVNPAFSEIINRSTNAQVISAGDHFQQLYTWRGAINAMKNSQNELSVTKTFRFGQSIAELSNKILSKTMEPPTDKISPFNENHISEIKSYNSIPDECDIILTRTRAEAFYLARTLSNNNHSFYLNVDISEWRDLIKSSLDLYNGVSGRKHPRISFFEDWFQLESYAETSMDSDLLTCINIVKSCHATLDDDLKKIINLNQAREEDAKIILSTTHRIKGRDWNNVAIHTDFTKSIFRAKNDDARLDDELKILYVAITRAKKKLFLPEGLLEELNSLSIE